MSVERIIGIDFGTSTSVMRVKRYQENGQPVDDRLYTAEVKFANNSLVPTLIRKMEAGEPYYGYDAQPGHRKKKSTLFDNFKVELESPDLQAREQARALTAEFFAYLAKRYKEQESRGFFGEADETEKTLISYPVKWSGETRSFMLEAARKAGFKNVEGMDEAQAAITAVMVQSADYLSKRGYLQDGMPANILMVDMGAGTTDLVLCRYTPGRNAKYEILSVWPRDGSTLFGGCEVEVILQGYLRSMLPEEDADIVMKRCSLNKFKSWKEDYVSRALSRNETVMEFTDFDDKVQDLEIDIEEYVIDRGEFEKMAADYLKGFPTLINGCLRDAGFSGDEVDLVLLTGGHSQWYFVKELLCGRLSQFGTVGLGKIQADPERIIPDPRPQETVALGLVYSPLAKEVRFAGEEEAKPISKPVHKEDAHTNAEAEVWDESMRVLPVTPEKEFEFQKLEGGYRVTKYLGMKDIISVPAQYKGKPVTEIGPFCFGERRYANRTIEIPGSVEIINFGAFEANHLERVILHEGIKKIMERAFSHAHISSIGLPDSLQTIDNYAFCKNDLRKIFIPANCTIIGMMAFKDNPALDSVVFPRETKISNLDEYAFLDTNIKNVKIPYYCKCKKLVRRLGIAGEKGGFFKKATPSRPEELISIERY